MKTTITPPSVVFDKATTLTKFPKKVTGFVAPSSWAIISYKAYPRLPQVLLPRPTKINITLTDALLQRMSTREYSQIPIRKLGLSNLLYYSSGVTSILSKKPGTRRFYPSAGARYPLEVYPLIFNVSGIPPGGYHYHIKSHSMERLLNKSLSKRIFDYIDQPWIERSAAILLITAIFNRTEEKYGSRGYRHILTEYGHIAQNIYLLSSALNIGACSIGGFLEEKIDRMLDLDYEDEGVIGFITLGKTSS